MKAYCGIDLADKRSAVCIVDAAGERCLERTVKTEEGALRRLLEDAGRRWGRMRVVVEASPLAEWAAGVVEGSGHEVEVIDARAARGVVRTKKKTDARDAYTLAQLVRGGWYRRVHRKSAESRVGRSVLRGREALVRAYRGVGSTIRGLLKAHGIRLGKVSRGRFAERVREVVEREVPELAEVMEGLLAVWTEAVVRAEAVEREVALRTGEDEVCRRLRTVPGVGVLVSAAFRATVDDPHRFRRGEEVADYLGLTPRVYQSGQTRYRGRISKEGDGLMRWLLVEAATVLLARGRDCALKRWGQALAERKGKAKARVAVARKLAVLLWRLWVREEVFRPWPRGGEEMAAVA